MDEELETVTLTASAEMSRDAYNRMCRRGGPLNNPVTIQDRLLSHLVGSTALIEGLDEDRFRVTITWSIQA